MPFLPWMSRSDRRRWRSARTVADLGELMALWLEGAIDSRPGYAPRHGPDEEAAHLVPTLAALCRAGCVITHAQPGRTRIGMDGVRWEKRAALELVVADAALRQCLFFATSDAGMIVRLNDYDRGGLGLQESPVTVTTCDGETITTVGGRIEPAEMAVQWAGLDPALYDEVSHGTYVSIAAPEYGTAGERLWRVLDLLTGLRRTDPAAPRASSTPPTGPADA